MKKVLKIFGSILFYGMLVVFVAAAFLFAVNTDENKSIFGYRFYEVLSGSMRPTIDVGELVIIKMVEQGDVKIDDIVTRSISDDGSLTVTHRVIDAYTDEDGTKMIVTQGDNNLSPDAAIPAASAIGTVVTHVPYVGYIVGFIKSNTMYVVFVAVAIIVLIAVLRRIFRKEKPSLAEGESTVVGPTPVPLAPIKPSSEQGQTKEGARCALGVSPCGETAKSQATFAPGYPESVASQSTFELSQARFEDRLRSALEFGKDRDGHVYAVKYLLRDYSLLPERTNTIPHIVYGSGEEGGQVQRPVVPLE